MRSKNRSVTGPRHILTLPNPLRVRMSTIVAVRKGNKASIVSDTLTTYGSTGLSAEYDAAPAKILHIKDTYIGIVGSAAHSLVFEHMFASHNDKFSFNSREEIFESFRLMHPLLKKEYFLTPEEEESHPYESSQIDAILINTHGIFGVHSLREVYQYNKFWATGSGWTYALGSMHSLYNRLKSPEQIAQAAVEAACEFDRGSSLPLLGHTIKLK